MKTELKPRSVPAGRLVGRKLFRSLNSVPCANAEAKAQALGTHGAWSRAPGVPLERRELFNIASYPADVPTGQSKFQTESLPI